MKVLHIASFYASSALYENLFTAIDEMGVTQTIYAPVKSEIQIGRYQANFSQPRSEVIFSKILNRYNRVNYWQKVGDYIADIEKRIEISAVDLIHAHSWYVDGGVALRLSEKYKVPFIVAVRNTDLNQYFKYMLFLRKQGLEILCRAHRIIFISAAYRKRIVDHPFFQSLKTKLEAKSLTISNGVDAYWAKNISPKTPRLLADQPFNLLFVGKLSAVKNLPRIMKAVILLNTRGFSCTLSIVGGDGSGGMLDILTGNRGVKGYVDKLVNKHPRYFNLLGAIADRDRLHRLYTSHDILVMPSLRETFGLVYIEALSQGLPLVYTKNEGIDGMFDEKIGEAVDPYSVHEIASAIQRIADNLPSYVFNAHDILKRYDWRTIADQYIQIYDSAE